MSTSVRRSPTTSLAQRTHTDKLDAARLLTDTTTTRSSPPANQPAAGRPQGLGWLCRCGSWRRSFLPPAAAAPKVCRRLAGRGGRLLLPNSSVDQGGSRCSQHGLLLLQALQLRPRASAEESERGHQCQQPECPGARHAGHAQAQTAPRPRAPKKTSFPFLRVMMLCHVLAQTIWHRFVGGGGARGTTARWRGGSGGGRGSIWTAIGIAFLLQRGRAGGVTIP